jgi:hypothetical protein
MRYCFCLLFGIAIVWGKCEVGFTEVPYSDSCIPCPKRYRCDGISKYPVECPENTFAIEGSSRCCSINASCPVGFALNANDNCSCSKIQCPPEASIMVYHQNSNEIQCKGGHLRCKPCPYFNMIQKEFDCDCVKYNFCTSYVKQTWFSSINKKFVCIGNH